MPTPVQRLLKLPQKLQGHADILTQRMHSELSDTMSAAVKALNAALDFSSTTLLKVLKPLSVAGDITTTGNLNGTNVNATSAVNAANVTASAAVQGATVTGTTSVTSPTVTGSTSVVSAAGFKSIIGPFTYRGTLGTGNSGMTYGCWVDMASVVNQTNYGTSVYGWVATHPGSITGISGTTINGTNTKTTTFVTIKNGSPIALTATTASLASGATGRAQTAAAKGTYTFVTGDWLAVLIRASVAGTGTDGSNVELTVEMSA